MDPMGALNGYSQCLIKGRFALVPSIGPMYYFDTDKWIEATLLITGSISATSAKVS